MSVPTEDNCQPPPDDAAITVGCSARRHGRCIPNPFPGERVRGTRERVLVRITLPYPFPRSSAGHQHWPVLCMRTAQSSSTPANDENIHPSRPPFQHQRPRQPAPGGVLYVRTPSRHPSKVFSPSYRCCEKDEIAYLDARWFTASGKPRWVVLINAVFMNGRIGDGQLFIMAHLGNKAVGFGASRHLAVSHVPRGQYQHRFISGPRLKTPKASQN